MKCITCNRSSDDRKNNNSPSENITHVNPSAATTENVNSLVAERKNDNLDMFPSVDGHPCCNANANWQCQTVTCAVAEDSNFVHQRCPGDSKICIPLVENYCDNNGMNPNFPEYGNRCDVMGFDCFYGCGGDDDLMGPPIGRDVRPIFNINILGFDGTALIDTAAKHCIAGHTLYALLQQNNHPLRVSSQRVRLADGVVRIMDVFTTTLDVRLETTIISTPFLIFPESTNNETLLGIDFITAAGVVIDFKEEVWFFSDDAMVKYNLCFEPKSRKVSCAATDILRDDEGTHLTPAERQALADVLDRHADIFRAGGGPTPFAEHRNETGEHTPISVLPYCLNPSKKPPDIILGKYHTQDLTCYHGNKDSLPKPVIPKRKRGRPAKAVDVLVQERGRSPGLEGEYIATLTPAASAAASDRAPRPIRDSRCRFSARFKE
ncbi:uncharacterized protein LOC114251801 [Bombyx mandarina]|uniref:Uncharacterized protein LOC114251801 n=1 Tax=Bombyx mandarina TaxID=7092 RepID=A0A6J2KKB6_BOMMA|nr:uncharacterized protein LOC114251801 [Bombyx mandarina]